VVAVGLGEKESAAMVMSLPACADRGLPFSTFTGTRPLTIQALVETESVSNRRGTYRRTRPRGLSAK